MGGVAVVDNEKPQLFNCTTGTQEVPTSAGERYGYLLRTVYARDNADEAPVLTCTPSAGTPLYVGEEYQSTCVAVDASKNAATCTWTLVVRDVEAPRLTCPVDRVIATAAGKDTGVLTFSPPTVIDNVDAALVATSQMC